MSRPATTVIFKMRWFPNDASCWAEKLWIDIKLLPLLPDEDKNFGSSLILDFRISWRQVQTKNYNKNPVELKHCETPCSCGFFYLMKLKPKKDRVIFNFGMWLRHMKTENTSRKQVKALMSRKNSMYPKLSRNSLTVYFTTLIWK